MRFGLNHITAPGLEPAAFFELARGLGITDVEIRNDTPDVMGHFPAAELRKQAANAGVRLVSINALYPFNQWQGDLPARAEAMADYAAASGAEALVMCPLNDGQNVSFEALVAALQQIKPILASRGIIGLVEPLGFVQSSLRTKAEAVRAIRAADGERHFKLVHDTFHHHLAGETEYFADLTGLVHISGVEDGSLTVAQMLDGDRVLVGDEDRLENIDQIKTLLADGYKGPFSFEPFAKSVQELANVKPALEASMAHIRAQVS